MGGVRLFSGHWSGGAERGPVFGWTQSYDAPAFRWDVLAVTSLFAAA
jgi:hypothetical protein